MEIRQTSTYFVFFRLILAALIAAEFVSSTRSYKLPTSKYDRRLPSDPIFDEDDNRCEPIQIKMCQGLGYNATRMPNRHGQYRQTEAGIELNSYQVLLQYNCSSELPIFLCAAFLPMCEPGLERTIGPCEGMCLSIKKLCLPALKSFGYPWPEILNCSNFPKDNKKDMMCMTGTHPHVKDEQPLIRPPKIKRSYCKQPQISLQSNEGCGWRCGYQQGMFSTEDKEFADLWMGVCSGVCFISTVFTVLTFLIDASRFRYPERPIILIAMCYNIYSISYILRLLVGRNNISCQRNTEGEMFLIKEGLGNTGCTVVFLLSYFFGMASYLWWVILTLTWFLAAGMKWSHEAIERHSSYFHLVAWSIPSIKIVIILILRHVDGDELTGMCYVGNQDMNALTGFVLAPLFTYLVIGTSFLLAGFFSLFRIKSYMEKEGSKTDKLERLMVKIGVFSVLYIVPASIVIGCYFYEHAVRRLWAQNRNVTPSATIYFLRILMQLVIGVFTGFWVWSKKSMQSWRQCSHSVLALSPKHQLKQTIDNRAPFVTSQHKLPDVITPQECIPTHCPHTGHPLFVAMPTSSGGAFSRAYRFEGKIQEPLLLSNNRVEGIP
ncbi:frizzled receptor [Ciona intestinalis]